MSTLVESIYALSIVSFFLLLFAARQSLIHEKERREWQAERKDLLDRIQAPSFAEYTNKVVREKKAEQPEEKQEQPEFIS